MVMSDNSPFSMSTMFNALQQIHLSNTRLKRLFNLMTSCEGVAQFKDLISTFDQSQLQMMASLLTSDSDYFMEVVRNKYGSRRVQKLLGVSVDVDALFYDAILQRFFDIMTDKYASYVAIRAVVVFDQVKKHVMYKHVLHYALDIARYQYGCVALNEVIIDADDPLYRNRLLDVVARNALFLSNDLWGNFVVQHCDRDRLMRLARSEIGNFVVLKALEVTQKMNRVDLFRDLVQKLMPLRHLLLRSHGSNIANILESCSIANSFCTMAPDNNPFSMSTMFNALQQIHLSNTRLKRLFNLMTSCEGVGQFKDLISTFDQSQLQMMASLLTSDSDYFMEVVSNKYGSRRVQKLLGISDDVDAFFYGAILQRFFDIMTDKYASYVAIRATVVFDQVKKHVMYKYLLHYALDIARIQYGCIALNEVLTDADDPLYRNRLLDVVARDALFLSNDLWGNFVVQHVLKLYDLRCTYRVAVSMGMVVVELLKCDGDRLMRLARSEFGNFVVLTALRVTQEMNRVDLFRDLVQKLMPLRHLLLRSHGNKIANVLETCSIATRYSN
ncbi:hypothetical protein HID58_009036 [Brassica napus]|uniref:PUM-HD domain-containing protein n=1 Tax=Brassica napus TaxID=3708 RepID=A0ABQ8DRB9_BRANA|nr:hypothetical protein HID58_009036 [Brassica napus]